MHSQLKVEHICGFKLKHQILTRSSIDFCLSTPTHMLLVIRGTIQIYTLPQITLLTTVQVSKQSITKIYHHSHSFFVLAGQLVFCYQFIESSFTLTNTLEGHLKKVNDIIITAQYLNTASDDYTIRLWNRTSPHNIVRVLAGHTGLVKVLKTFHKYLVSADTDGLIIIWEGAQKFHQFKCSHPIVDLLLTAQSQELIVATSAKQLELLSLKQLSSQRRVSKLKRLDVQTPGSKGLIEISDNLLVIWNHQGLIFCDKYLDKILNRTPLENTKSVISFNLMLMAVCSQGIYLENLLG